jgi:lysophospholipase L1-like esterase
VKRILLLLAIVIAALMAGCSGAGQAAPDGQGGAADVGNSPSLNPDTFGGTVWVIGDSITVGASDKFALSHPDALVNAETGRRFDQGIRELTNMLDEAAAPNVLVFALGTNNGATPDQVSEVVALASDVDRIVFVNVSVPRGWELDTNAALEQAAARFDNVTVVDWYATASADDSLLRSDGYHPNADGSVAWAAMIAAAINS